MGCLGVGEAAKFEQLIANQGQEWMGIRSTSKRSWFSEEVKRGIGKYKGEPDDGEQEAKGGVNLELLHVCTSVHIYAATCYLRITLFCV